MIWWSFFREWKFWIFRERWWW